MGVSELSAILRNAVLAERQRLVGRLKKTGSENSFTIKYLMFRG